MIAHNQSKWDKYFYDLCVQVGKNSKCLSRQIGAVLVKDNIIIATGYNGPPRQIPDCNHRYKDDQNLKTALYRNESISVHADLAKKFEGVCPRRPLEYPSGEGLEWCPSIHSEKNCLLAAARLGHSTKGSTLYADMSISPCSQCFGALINAGVVEVVCVDPKPYDVTVEYLMQHRKINIRRFMI